MPIKTWTIWPGVADVPGLGETLTLFGALLNGWNASFVFKVGVTFDGTLTPTLRGLLP